MAPSAIFFKTAQHLTDLINIVKSIRTLLKGHYVCHPNKHQRITFSHTSNGRYCGQILSKTGQTCYTATHRIQPTSASTDRRSLNSTRCTRITKNTQQRGGLPMGLNANTIPPPHPRFFLFSSSSFSFVIGVCVCVCVCVCVLNFFFLLLLSKSGCHSVHDLICHPKVPRQSRRTPHNYIHGSSSTFSNSTVAFTCHYLSLFV